jgi:hypothetical protein
MLPRTPLTLFGAYLPSFLHAEEFCFLSHKECIVVVKQSKSCALMKIPFKGILKAIIKLVKEMDLERAVRFPIPFGVGY